MKKTAVIFTISLVLQMVAIFAADIPVENDARIYDTITVNLVSGKGFSIDGISPAPAGYVKQGYILFLAFIYMIFGHNILMVKLIQAFLVAASCAIIFKIGAELFNERIGYYSALLMAFHPVFLILSSHLISESLFTFLLLLSILYLARALRQRSLKLYAYSGIFLGLSVQVRVTTMFFPIFVIIGLLFFYKEKMYALKAGALILLLAVLISLPWFIRNYICFGSSNTFIEYGGALWMGSYTSGKAYQDTPEFKKKELQLNQEFRSRYSENGIYSGLIQLERQRNLLKLGIENIKKDFLGYIGLFPIKILRLWTGSYGGIFRMSVAFNDFLRRDTFTKHPFIVFWKSFVFLYSLVIFYLGVIGMALNFKRWKGSLPLYLVVIYFTLLHMAVYANCRLGIPALPYMILFTVLCLGSYKKEKLQLRPLKERDL